MNRSYFDSPGCIFGLVPAPELLSYLVPVHFLCLIGLSATAVVCLAWIGYAIRAKKWARLNILLTVPEWKGRGA